MRSRGHNGFAGDLKILGGSSNPGLARRIAGHLGLTPGSVALGRFRDGEVRLQIHDNVRGADVFVIQSTCPPVDEHLVELLIMVDALKRASAARINAVLPYYGYARQDRKDRPRVPISAKLVADLLTVAGAHRVIAMDLHAGQIQGYFDIPVDHLFAAPVMIDFIRDLDAGPLIVVSPDAGGVERARAFGKRLGVGIAVMDKRRDADNDIATMHVVGDVAGRTALVVDDIVDSAGTLVRAAEALHASGARRVMAICTHPVLSGEAVRRIEEGPLERVIVSDTIPIPARLRAASTKLHVLSVASLLARAIESVHSETSVSSLFG